MVETILIVDDDPTARLVLKKALENAGHEVFVAGNGKEGLERAREVHPALIICDWMMPKMNGIELCRQVKSDPELETTFFILLTSRERVNDRIEGLDSGADEFLCKPIEVQELRARVRAGLRLSSLTRQLKEANQKLLVRNQLLESLSLTDPLTGMLNRRAFDRSLPHLLQQFHPEPHHENARYLCLFVLDIDRFKLVNDTYGHLVGDRVLKVVAERLQESGHPNSSFYRYGGEEFTCITPGINRTTALLYGEHLRRAIADFPVELSQEKTLSVTISIGGAMTLRSPVPDGSDTNLVTAQRCVHQADRALYQAKKEGRNCVRISEAGMMLEDL